MAKAPDIKVEITVLDGDLALDLKSFLMQAMSKKQLKPRELRAQAKVLHRRLTQPCLFDKSAMAQKSSKPAS